MVYTETIKPKHQKRLERKTPLFHENIQLPLCEMPENDSKTTLEEVNKGSEIEIYDKNEKDYCVICCEELGKGKHGELKCGHKFHKKCIKQWMEVSAHKDCPTCRESQTNSHSFLS